MPRSSPIKSSKKAQRYSDKKVRLQKYLSECGVASRRKSEQMIKNGDVEVNGEVVQQLGVSIDPAHDKVQVKGRIVKPVEKGVLLLHKPRAVVSTLNDPEGRKALNEYLTKHQKSYFPVGRLDFDSTGLMILTNDGEMADLLMHPRYGFERVYRVRVEGIVNNETIDKIERGVRLEDGMASAKLSFLERDKDTSTLQVRVTEGRNRLVRRIFQRVGHPVVKLVRLEHGPFRLGKLRPGQVRKLTEKEYFEVRKKVLIGANAQR